MWLAVMWAGFALAFLTKGPPGLLPLLAVVAFDLLTPGPRASAPAAVVGPAAVRC